MTTRQLAETKGSIRSLADETIAFIEGQHARLNVDALLSSNGSRGGSGVYVHLLLLALKGVELEQLENFLQALSHQQLLGIVYEHSSVLEETISSLTMSLASKTVANPLYAALEQAHAILELQVELGWDVSMEDLRKFAKAISKSYVTILIVHSDRFRAVRP
ncbi:hypothetical protein BGZ83_006974 [Gryganskiella cystojenkinii]|nr:hypothetical protein BGZ83_006974 [Gryganskiella cystojenkinii]